jgi:hypothetical protein
VIEEKFTLFQKTIEERIGSKVDEFQKEILSRCSFLASISIELQRLNSEIDNKINFLKSIMYNSEKSTLIALTTVFNDYMENELIPNIDLILNMNLEGITDIIK